MDMFNVARWGNIHMALLATTVAASLDFDQEEGREALS
jgi:hypothetical protein